MSDLTLVIANKNYSSWSLRPWLLMRQLDIPFEEILLPLDTPEFAERIGDFSAARRVPVLVDGDCAVWDSLAIIEYLAEKYPDKGVWPADRNARATARSVAAEMHSGFTALRNALPMNIRRHHPDFAIADDVSGDIRRITQIWQDSREEFGGGGEFLFGAFSAADAFYAPVVWRFVSYDVRPGGAAEAYMNRMLALPAMQEWKAAAEAEPWTVSADEA